MNYKLIQLKTKKKSGLKFLIKEFLVYRRGLVLTGGLLLLIALTSAWIPKLIEQGTNQHIITGDLTGINKLSALILIVIIITAVAFYYETRLAGHISQKVVFNIRQKIYAQLQTLPLAFFSHNQSGEIIQRVTENVNDIDRFFQHGFLRLVNMASKMMLVFIFMFVINWQIAAIVLSGVIIILLFLLIQGNILHKMSNKYLAMDSHLAAFDQETLDGHKVIAAFNQKQFWVERFQKRNQQFYQYSKKYNLVSVSSDGFLSIVSNITTFLVLFVSLSFFSQQQLAAGTVILLTAYSFSVFKKMNGISNIWMNLQRGLAAADRLQLILKLKANIVEIANPYDPPINQVRGAVEFKHVTFSYAADKKPALKNLNLKIKPGQSVAIVGPTGAGKTTFVNLIARLYDPDKGRVLVDGVDVKNWELDNLRSKIGYLIQDTFLFEDTILNNLRYNNPAVTQKQASAVFKQLGASSLIKQLPQGLMTKINSQGNNLSAGQRQIVALARVLLRQPKVLILDEATAKIDTKSEKMIQTAIEKSTQRITSFIIAHRLSTIFNSDLIMVINDNTIIECGAHKDLLKKKGVYFEMYSRFVR